MTSKEALKEIKEGISYGFYDGKSLGYYKNHFKHIEKELNNLQALYNKIKEKRDNARLERDEYARKQNISDEEKSEVRGEIWAYSDILKLMENMFEGIDHESN